MKTPSVILALLVPPAEVIADDNRLAAYCDAVMAKYRASSRHDPKDDTQLIFFLDKCYHRVAEHYVPKRVR